MKHYETEIIPAQPETKKEIHAYSSCDMCGDKLPNNAGYDQSKVKISCTTSTEYPEGGSGTTKKIDMCEACFNNRLIPWLEENNVSIREKDWNY